MGPLRRFLERQSPSDDRIRRAEAARAGTRSQSEDSERKLDELLGSAGDITWDGLPLSARVVVSLLRADRALHLSASTRARLAGVSSIGQAAGVLGARMRGVVLSDAWWESDIGHLVGYRRGIGPNPDGQRASQEVALIKLGGRGYVLEDPATGQCQRVTKEVAEELEGFAQAIYPPLPEKLARPFDLARYLFPMVRRDLSAVVASGAITGLAGIAFPVAAAFIIDELVAAGERRMMLQVALGLAAVAITVLAFATVREIALVRIDGRSEMVLRAALWDRLLRLPVSFFKDYSAGDLSQRVVGIANLRHAVTEVALSATVTAAFSLAYVALLLFYDWRLALLAVLLVSLYGAVAFNVGRAQLRHHRRQIEIGAWLSGFLFPVLQGIAKLRMAGAEDRAFARWADRYADERREIIAARTIANHFSAFADAYVTLSSAILFFAVAQVAGGKFTAGMLVAFLAAFTSLQVAVDGLARAALAVIAVLPDWERARPILDAEPEVPPTAADPGPLNGEIEVSGVSFAYGDGEPVLRGVSLTAHAGEQIAIVGASGSGKSTLVRILLGLEKPGSGTVLYDGQDLSGLDHTGVRRQIGVVMQDGRLFAGSIADNVRGATAVSLEACADALAAAGFSDDLADLPMGLHTPLTDGAPALSGGQRQRVLIARALVNQPRILVLDEATSALDNQTQAIVTASLARLNVTRIVIAHRLSTIIDADRIYVLTDGEIAESGTYEELLAQSGRFARLVERQQM